MSKKPPRVTGSLASVVSIPVTTERGTVPVLPVTAAAARS